MIDRYHPTEVGVESVYFGANTQSAFATAQARGAALVACAQCGLQTGEYTPMQIKQAVVGTGTADKQQVQYMVKTLLHLEKEPRPDHCADALAAAVCHAHLVTWRARPAASSSASWPPPATTQSALLLERGMISYLRGTSSRAPRTRSSWTSAASATRWACPQTAAALPAPEGRGGAGPPSWR